MRLDHLVINTRFATDAARSLFEALGLPVRLQSERGTIALPEFETLLEFIR